MISEAIGAACKRIIDAIVRALVRSRMNPNVLTFIGLLINIGCAALFGYGRFFAAGLLMIFANLFDMLDGQVARLRGRVTQFGAFFDSALDRYSDIIVYVGIMIFYARDTVAHSTLLVALTGLALVGSVMVSYSRARAENLIPACKVGFAERPERVVLLIIGALFDRMAPVLCVIAVISNLTVIHRMMYTFQQAKQLEEAQLRGAGVAKSKQS